MTDAKKDWEEKFDKEFGVDEWCEFIKESDGLDRDAFKKYIRANFIPKEEVKERLERLKFTGEINSDYPEYSAKQINQRIQKEIEECK